MTGTVLSYFLSGKKVNQILILVKKKEEAGRKPGIVAVFSNISKKEKDMSAAEWCRCGHI